MNKRHIVLTAVCIVGLFYISIAQKNHFVFEVGLNISRTYFDQSFHQLSSISNIDFVYENQPTVPLLTANYCFGYNRSFGSKNRIGLWGRTITKGQKGKFRYNSEVVSNMSARYGGLEYNLFYRSFELGLNWHHILYSTELLDIEMGLKPSIDFYWKQGYRPSNFDALYGMPSLADYHGWLQFEHFYDGIHQGVYRIGLFGELNLVLKTRFKFLSIIANVGAGYYTKELKQKYNKNILDGNIFLATTNLGLMFSI